MDNFRFAQLDPFLLAGAGAVIGDTTLTLQSMLGINGDTLTMSGTFGQIGYGTLEPGNGSLEEQISFSGLTNNTNGTVTLTGVKSVLFVYPYTETSGLSKTHAGSSTFIISNTSGFYSKFVARDDDGVISETLTFTNPLYPRMDTQTPAPTDPQQLVTKSYADSLAIAGAPNASTSVNGLVQIATQAQVDAKTIIGSTSAYIVAPGNTRRSTLLSDYVADTGTTNVIVITPSPAISAYTTGQQFSFKLLNTNTSPTVSLNVNGLGAKNVTVLNGTSPAVGDLPIGGMITVEYDGTNFQVQSPISQQLQPTGSIIMYGGSSAPQGWLLCNGSAVSRATYANLFTTIGVLFGNGDASTTFNVPNMGGRFVAGPSPVLSNTIGATGGSTILTIPSVNIPSTYANVQFGGGLNGLVNQANYVVASQNVVVIPPYVITNYLIKT